MQRNPLAVSSSGKSERAVMPVVSERKGARNVPQTPTQMTVLLLYVLPNNAKLLCSVQLSAYDFDGSPSTYSEWNKGTVLVA